jgi:hypothetical protein
MKLPSPGSSLRRHGHLCGQVYHKFHATARIGEQQLLVARASTISLLSTATPTT